MQHLSAAQEDMVTAMITNAGARVRNDFFMVLSFSMQRNITDDPFAYRSVKRLRCRGFDLSKNQSPEHTTIH